MTVFQCGWRPICDWWFESQLRLPFQVSFSMIPTHTAGGCGEKLQRRSKNHCRVTSPQPLAFCAPWSKFMYSGPPPTLTDHRLESVALIASTLQIELAIRTLGEVMGLIVRARFSHGPGNLGWPRSPGWRDLCSAALICTQWALTEFFFLTLTPSQTHWLHLCVFCFGTFQATITSIRCTSLPILYHSKPHLEDLRHSNRIEEILKVFFSHFASLDYMLNCRKRQYEKCQKSSIELPSYIILSERHAFAAFSMWVKGQGWRLASTYSAAQGQFFLKFRTPPCNGWNSWSLSIKSLTFNSISQFLCTGTREKTLFNLPFISSTWWKLS